MKRLLITTALLLLAAPALAAPDYVQCREMLRTMNELVEKATDIENPVRVARNDSCPRPGSKAWQTCVDSRIPATPLVSQAELVSLAGKDFVKDMVITSAAALKYVNAAQKVRADMKKADCPYQ